MKLLNIHERSLLGSEKRFLSEKVLADLFQEKQSKLTKRLKKRPQIKAEPMIDEILVFS